MKMARNSILTSHPTILIFLHEFSQFIRITIYKNNIA